VLLFRCAFSPRAHPSLFFAAVLKHSSCLLKRFPAFGRIPVFPEPLFLTSSLWTNVFSVMFFFFISFSSYGEQASPNFATVLLCADIRDE